MWLRTTPTGKTLQCHESRSVQGTVTPPTTTTGIDTVDLRRRMCASRAKPFLSLRIGSRRRPIDDSICLHRSKRHIPGRFPPILNRHTRPVHATRPDMPIINTPSLRVHPPIPSKQPNPTLHPLPTRKATLPRIRPLPRNRLGLRHRKLRPRATPPCIRTKAHNLDATPNGYHHNQQQ